VTQDVIRHTAVQALADISRSG